MINEVIKAELFELQDLTYRDFQCKLLPTVASSTVIGVRTPDLRKLAKEVSKQDSISSFLNALPHKYFEENQLHAFILSGIKDYEQCLKEVNRFLPYVDNWATCDQLSLNAFKKHKAELLNEIKAWLKSDKTYTVRFGVGLLMKYFLDEDFDPIYLSWVSCIKTDEYYINMMKAWYFATALAKQYEATLPYIEGQKLALWVHNKTIQKATESYRITKEQKEYLATLKVRA